jgi:3-oxoacyl-(acyl-carrier-protein) synthase
LIINSDLGANTAAENYALVLYGKGPERVSPFEFTKSVANCVVGDVARQFKLTGPSSFIIGENSISYGIDLLKSGKADIMICGGFDEVRERTVWNYSRRNLTLPVNGHLLSEKDFEEREENMNKMIFGEGAGFVVLETEQHAVARKARIYAEVIGEYSSCDSLCNEVIWERDATDLSYTMQRALQSSGISVDKIDFIVGASCLPWQLLSYEMPAIRQIWKNVPVKYTTVKSRTGETFSSAPPISFSVAAAALYNREIPSSGWKSASLKLRENPLVVIDRITDMTATYCLVNSIQVGGNTTAIVLKTYSEN